MTARARAALRHQVASHARAREPPRIELAAVRLHVEKRFASRILPSIVEDASPRSTSRCRR